MSRGFGAWRSFGRSNKTNTNSLTKAVLTFLNTSGWVAWRNNNIPVFDISKAAKGIAGKQMPNSSNAARSLLSKFFRKNNVFKGVPDIIGFHKKTGRFIGVEIKTGSDRVSMEQAHFLTMLQQSGGVAIVCRDFDAFLAEYNAKC